ncbi:class I SAM-dependent methyltransferase [Suttonella sp. R2A3]|uniref:class I SAM-dependent methyltransferase n=1 Tax=Suttonella sp. R2A3 TaxID=2908648 RepID=UPI001F1D2781|nr:class I SAM-dependent methyltransferase [Suttonella sp. R2A3]UJF24052.1 class I SAM-dependent methyltransferase [Suttonella sp. R2A3]
MLWTLHNRASEAMRKDGCIRDEMCLAIYRALDYDYTRHFGEADGSHGVRSQLFDDKIREFLNLHPDGVIVNLGEGLETQRYRIASEDALWISVDLPEAIALRERFIQPDAQHLHIAKSALDTAWFDAVPPDRAVMITAQGLFMYFDESQLHKLFAAIAERFPRALMMFDYLSVSLSKRSISEKGWMKTPYYRTPPMPWGVNRNHLASTLSRWVGKAVTPINVTFLYPRGMLRYIVPICEHLPHIRNIMPGVCFCHLPARSV